MSQAKLGLLSVLTMLAVLLLCGIAASGASAIEWELNALKECTGGETVNFCYEKEATGKLFVFKGTGEFEVLVLLANQHILLESKLGGETIHIECKAVDAEHEEGGVLVPDGLIFQLEPLKANALLEFHLTFLECQLEGAVGKKCKVPAERTTKPLIGEFDALPAGGLPFDDDDIMFTPVTPSIFIEIPFEDNLPEKCPATIKGTHNVTGEILCFVDKTEEEALTDQEEHELICDPAREESQKGKLLFAENEATLLAEADIFILNIGTDLWSISNEA